MDPKVLASTFVAVFVAELGDKTQLATMSLSAGSSKLSVFCGAALALVCSTAMAVLLGEQVERVVGPQWIQRGAGVLLLVLGMVYLVQSFRGEA